MNRRARVAWLVSSSTHSQTCLTGRNPGVAAFSAVRIPSRIVGDSFTPSRDAWTLTHVPRRTIMSSSNTDSNTNPDESTTASAVVDVARNLRDVQDQIDQACRTHAIESTRIRLVAVSKTKPIELLQQAYDAGCRVFGENYAQELADKVPLLNQHDGNNDTVSWHFIGGLQSNKCNMLLKPFLEQAPNGPTVANLTIETVATVKLANKLNHAVPEPQTLKIFVQVNTSGEDSKSGIEPAECVALCRHVAQECPRLQLQGLMTIGAVGDLSCFDILVDLRRKVAIALERDTDDLELSMGMSGDFVQAIAAGATNVRVGSTIFGARNYDSPTSK
jgi:pyridoxal phosphate enzyme (YggS family)